MESNNTFKVKRSQCAAQERYINNYNNQVLGLSLLTDKEWNSKNFLWIKKNQNIVNVSNTLTAMLRQSFGFINYD